MDLKILTLEQKCKFLTGKNFWQTEDFNGKLPTVFFSDGPSGLRRLKDINFAGGEEVTAKATAYPCSVAVASTWNCEIAYQIGNELALECAENHVDVLLAPGCNIKRTPLCGRNFEYFSEDPFLSGHMAKSFILGVQENGIGACLKHFCLNNRESFRFLQSSEVDERALYEIYLKTFEIALEAKPAAVMCSYNPINGVFASENRKFLKNILRDKFGFAGVIISDWAAVHDRSKALKATLDLEMPYSEESLGNLMDAIERGFITETEIDESVTRILNLIDLCKNNMGKRKVELDKNNRHETALRAARESIVLLKNEGNILPLKAKKIAVIGFFCEAPAYGGGGSSFVMTDWKIPALHDEISKKMDAKVSYAKAYYLQDITQIFQEKQALKIAYENEIAIIVVGSYRNDESEGMDRMDIKLRPYFEKLISDVAKLNSNTIVVIESGSAVDVSFWIDDVKAVIYAPFGGEAVNEAISDIICGKICPSGKIAETFPQCIEDTACKTQVGNGFSEIYTEGIFVGYRYYDQDDKKVRFPFGYGLSYASFVYTNLMIVRKSQTDFEITYMIKNTSQVDGAEVSQVYVKDVFSMVVRPQKELKGFRKDFIKAGESVTVCIVLDKTAFSYYSTVYDDWHIENGSFEIMVGSSSRDIWLKQTIEIEMNKDSQHSEM